MMVGQSQIEVGMAGKGNNTRLPVEESAGTNIRPEKHFRLEGGGRHSEKNPKRSLGIGIDQEDLLLAQGKGISKIACKGRFADSTRLIEDWIRLIKMRLRANKASEVTLFQPVKDLIEDGGMAWD